MNIFGSCHVYICCQEKAKKGSESISNDNRNKSTMATACNLTSIFLRVILIPKIPNWETSRNSLENAANLLAKLQF